MCRELHIYTMKCSPRHAFLSLQVLLEYLSQAIFYTFSTLASHRLHIPVTFAHLSDIFITLATGPFSLLLSPFPHPFFFLPPLCTPLVSSSSPAVLPCWCCMVSLLCFVGIEAAVRALCSAGSSHGQAESDSEQSLPWERDVKPWPSVGSRMRAVILSLGEALSSQQRHNLP